MFAGIMHFVIPKTYEAIMPDWLPAHRELVYASGVAEFVGGALTIHPATRKAGVWLSVLTLIGVYPANVHMALNPDDYKDVPKAALYGRLPFQALFIAWAIAAGRRNDG
ncbi:MAG: hypothetical protein H0V29_08380 [Thermoleophilaceae bacterium]|nr:hypothetical protein [Thermoleophilaceae bacterium]